MVLALWLFVITFASAILEAALGTSGWSLPLLAAAAFYLSAACGWRQTVFPALAAGAVLDIAFGRTLPVTSLCILPLAIALARFWRKEGNCRSFRLQIIPGVACGFAQGAILAATQSFPAENFFLRLVVHNLFFMGGLMIGGGLLLPILAWGLDRGARRLSLPRYHTAQHPERPDLHVS